MNSCLMFFLQRHCGRLKRKNFKNQKSFFEEHKMEDYVPSKRFARKIKRTYRMYVIKRYLSSRTMWRTTSILLIVGMISGSLIFLAEANGFSLYETILFERGALYLNSNVQTDYCRGSRRINGIFLLFPNIFRLGLR